MSVSSKFSVPGIRPYFSSPTPWVTSCKPHKHTPASNAPAAPNKCPVAPFVDEITSDF